uniref:Transmembrane protein n=1 Tax=Mesocestoides corti TaxID=53468 RepID=A0A5K3EK79_MESCO
MCMSRACKARLLIMCLPVTAFWVRGDLSNFDAHAFAAPAGVAENDLGNQTFPRPNFLTLHNFVDKSVEAVGSSGSDEGVLVAGADSLNASPTVSSGNGTLSFALSPDAEEVAHLRECVRLANKEIEHYKAHIAELQMTAASENKATSGDSDALEDMRVECCVLRARIGDIEDQMEQTRENHRRLVEETRQHRTEVENLRTQRAELEAALAEAQANIAALESKDRQQHPSTAFNHLSPPTSCLADSSAHSDRIELVPGRLVTASSLTVIPLMLLVFAVMLAIFSKFVS